MQGQYLIFDEIVIDLSDVDLPAEKGELNSAVSPDNNGQRNKTLPSAKFENQTAEEEKVEEQIRQLEMEVDLLERIHLQTNIETSLKVGALETAIHEVEFALREARKITAPRFALSGSRLKKSYIKAVIDRLSALLTELNSLKMEKRAVQPIQGNWKSNQSSEIQLTVGENSKFASLNREKAKLHEEISQAKKVKETFSHHLINLVEITKQLTGEIKKSAQNENLNSPHAIEFDIRQKITNTLKGIEHQMPLYYSPRVKALLNQ